MGIYMKYGDIKGDSTLKGFKQWINLSNFHWEVDRAVTKQPAGRGTSREAQKPDLKEFDVTKEADSASMLLLKETCCAKTPYKCEISFVRTGEDIAYMTYIFHEALITKITTTTGQEGAQSEVITFNFVAVEAALYVRTEDNQRGDRIPFPYYSLVEHQ